MRQNASTNAIDGQKWLVAIDPFSDLDISRVITFVKGLAEQSSARLRGVYVLAPESLNWTGEFSGPWMNRYLPFAQEKAREVSKKFGVEIDVVPCQDAGLRPSVRALVKHAKRWRADLILLSTHARSGIERWTLGSYAETLILASTIPVLVVNPNNRLPERVNKILVPTDLSRKSERFVISLGAFAKAASAELDLFYKQPDPLDPMIQQGVYAVGGGWVSVQSYLDTEITERRKQLEKLRAAVEATGVTADTSIGETSGSLIQSINDCAKQKNVDMIALLTQSGPLEAAVLGSVARELVRSSTIPVLIRR